MRLMTLLLPVVVLASACDSDCTEIALASVTLEVRSAAGQPLPDADVTFTLDGGPERDAESFGDGTFVLGREEPGAFEATVAAEGHEPETRSYTVTADACHVDPVEDEVVLEESP